MTSILVVSHFFGGACYQSSRFSDPLRHPAWSCKIHSRHFHPRESPPLLYCRRLDLLKQRYQRTTYDKPQIYLKKAPKHLQHCNSTTSGPLSRLLCASSLDTHTRDMSTSSTPGSAALLRRQLKQMQTDKDIPGISCGLVHDNNIYEWEVMLMINDETKYYGGTASPSFRHSLFHAAPMPPYHYVDPVPSPSPPTSRPSSTRRISPANMPRPPSPQEQTSAPA